VESFWMLDNPSEHKEVILLPDGRIDLIFSQSPTEPLHVVLLGIGTHPEHVIITEKTRDFCGQLQFIGNGIYFASEHFGIIK
jgi:hypothetical protein